MVKLHHIHTIFAQEKAIEAAKVLNSDPDEDWVYVVENNPDPEKEAAIIRIFDEDNEFVGLV